MRFAILLTLAVLAPCAAAGEVFKCRMPDGSLAFLDHPCPDAAKPMDAPKLSSEVPFAWSCGPNEPEPLRDDEKLAHLPQAQREALAGAAWGFAYTRTQGRLFLDRGGNAHLCADTERGVGELVVTPEGRIWSKRDGKVERLDRHDRVSRLASCGDRITRCYQPNVKSLDQCVDEAPICSTSEPVEGEPACCAQACVARYRELRAQDLGPITAFDRALYDNEACSGVQRARAD